MDGFLPFRFVVRDLGQRIRADRRPHSKQLAEQGHRESEQDDDCRDQPVQRGVQGRECCGFEHEGRYDWLRTSATHYPRLGLPRTS